VEAAVLTPGPSGERVSDELDTRASAHSDTKALQTLTVPIDQMCFFHPRRTRRQADPRQGAALE